MNSIIGLLIVIALVGLAIWRLSSTWIKRSYLKRYGTLVMARVTQTKREARLMDTFQRTRYSDCVYAEWTDPVSTYTYQFKFEVVDLHQFAVGEEIPVRLNLANTNDYILDYSQPKQPKQAVPKEAAHTLEEQTLMQHQTPKHPE